jgi:hypothetical protein
MPFQIRQLRPPSRALNPHDISVLIGFLSLRAYNLRASQFPWRLGPPHALTTRWDSQLSGYLSPPGVSVLTASQSSRRLDPRELVVLARPAREKDGQQKDISVKESPKGPPDLSWVAQPTAASGGIFDKFPPL